MSVISVARRCQTVSVPSRYLSVYATGSFLHVDLFKIFLSLTYSPRAYSVLILLQSLREMESRGNRKREILFLRRDGFGYGISRQI